MKRRWRSYKLSRVYNRMRQLKSKTLEARLNSHFTDKIKTELLCDCGSGFVDPDYLKTKLRTRN